MYVIRSNLNVPALKQAEGLAAAPRHCRRDISIRAVTLDTRQVL
jgi:hypothetical protein